MKAHVIFYDRYVSLEDLKEFIGATDIYLTPYLQKAKVTSGTLAYVFGAGKAVVSTPYWHAEELLADGRGVLVPFRDTSAIAQAVCALLDDPTRMRAMQRAAYTLGREMVWPVVAERYLQSFERARADRVGSPRAAFAKWTLAHRPLKLPTGCLDHVLGMTDGTGIFQHANFNVPSYLDATASMTTRGPSCSVSSSRSRARRNREATWRGSRRPIWPSSPRPWTEGPAGFAIS